MIQSNTPQPLVGYTYHTAQHERLPRVEPFHLRRDDEPIRSASVRTGVNKILILTRFGP